MNQYEAKSEFNRTNYFNFLSRMFRGPIRQTLNTDSSMGILRSGEQNNMTKNCFAHLRVGVNFLGDVSVMSVIMMVTIHGLCSERKYMVDSNLKI